MILIGTRRGLFLRQSDTEDLTQLGPEDLRVASVAQTGTGRYYAVTGDGGVLMGDIGADTVHDVQEGLSHRARCVYVHGGGDVYVGTEPSAVYRFDKGSRAWELVSALHDLDIAQGWSAPRGSPAVRSIAAHPNEKACFYVNIHVGGVIRTEDGGLSWTASSDGLEEDVHQVAINPSEPEALYCATADGFYWSPDEGDSWEARNEGLDNRYCRAIAPNPYNPDIVLISGSPTHPGGWGADGKRFAVFRSEDGGMHWSRVTDGLPAEMAEEIDTDCLEFSGLRPDWVICGSKDGTLYESFDGGRSWCVALSGLPPIQSLAVL